MDYTIDLRASLDAHGFAHTMIVLPDGGVGQVRAPGGMLRWCSH
jgi:hypothetical protein